MENEILNSASGTENAASDNSRYIEALKEMNKTHVARSEFERLEQENQMLIDALRENRQLDSEVVHEAKPDVSELRKELFKEDNDMSNLDFWSKTMELRTALIESGEPDPFLPIGKRISPEPDDVYKANRLAEGIQHCIDTADGDRAIFTNELQRITIDSNPYGSINRRR